MAQGSDEQHNLAGETGYHGVPSATRKWNEDRHNVGTGDVSESFAVFRLTHRTNEWHSHRVRSKIEKGIGISFSEFTYPLLQAWDWWHMHQAQGITVQIGGSDQLGNIMAGIDAVKHLLKTDSDPAIQKRSEQLALKPMGFTVPLLTTASGEKFGKSAGNAVWLDKQMTSIFDQYQVSTDQTKT